MEHEPSSEKVTTFSSSKDIKRSETFVECSENEGLFHTVTSQQKLEGESQQEYKLPLITEVLSLDCENITPESDEEVKIHEEARKEFLGESIKNKTNVELNEDDDNIVDNSVQQTHSPHNQTEGEDDKLLSDISELVDSKSSFQGGNNAEESSGEVDNQRNVNSNNKTLHEEMEDTEYSEEGEKTEVSMPAKLKTRESKTINTVESNACDDAFISNNKQIQENKQFSSTESAFQRLASLGVIAQEKPLVESKESALIKLASRGAISITPAGGSLTSMTGSSISISPAKPTYKPEPKLASNKQKAKKIKIDPGNSTDIEKDFNCLISFLSTGSDQEKALNRPDAKDQTLLNESVVSEPKTFHNKSVSDIEINDDQCADQSTNDGLGSGMDVDISDDRSVHETDSESHDGSKSFTHSPDPAEESDERMPTNSSKIKNVIEEGSAEILLSASKNVFYNKVQEFNRDMSIAALTVFSEMHQQDPRTRNRGQKRKAPSHNESDASETSITNENVFVPGKKAENGIKILEALSATGLRSIRYAREVPGVKEVIANDLSEDAVETIKKNIEHNGVSDIVTTTMSDASLLMYQHQAGQEWYDAIDLDPYGCPSRFLDSAVQAVSDGGLLLVTCTDMAVLAGNSPETCYTKYGAVGLRTPSCHEMALRIALQCISSHATRYGRYIVPLLSFSADFYIRLIVQIYTSPVTCKKTTSKLSMVYQCVGCHTHSLHPLGQASDAGPNSQTKYSMAHGPPVNTTCFHCHHKHYMGGPIWSAPMYNNKFVESMLRVVECGMFGTSKRMQGMLEVIREELPDVPLYYTIQGLCSKLHCQAIPLIDIRSAILNTGYRVSSSHAAPTAIKTNAPAKIIWDIMRCWVHMNPVSQKRLIPGSVPAAIILEPPNLIANFDIHPKARPSSSMRKLVRYQQNPEKNWGPGMRARCNNAEDTKDEKRRANQNKNKNKAGNKKHIDIIEVVTIDDEDEIIVEDSGTETAATSTALAS